MKTFINLILSVIALIGIYVAWQYIQSKPSGGTDTTVTTTIDPQTGAVRVQENTKKPCLNLPGMSNCP